MKKVILILIGALIGGIGVVSGILYILNSFSKLDGVTMVSGKLRIVKQAEDDILNLKDMGPVIFRTTEMYQHRPEKYYTKNSIWHYYVSDGFEHFPVETFEGYRTEEEGRRGMTGTTIFKNPKFPKEFLNENNDGRVASCGTVEIGKKGIRLDSSFLTLFYGKSMEENEDEEKKGDVLENALISILESVLDVKNFGYLEDCLVPAYDTPEDGGKKYGLKLVGKGVYASGKDGHPKLGDLRMTCQVVDPRILKKEFTAVGKLSKDGKLLTMDGVEGALYDRKVTMAEVKFSYRKYKIFKGLFLIGSGIMTFAFFAVLGMIPGRKKRTSTGFLN